MPVERNESGSESNLSDVVLDHEEGVFMTKREQRLRRVASKEKEGICVLLLVIEE